MPTKRLPLRFGEGLDRETGIQAVQPNTFFDLRNCFLHEGKIVLRNGFVDAGEGEFEEIDLILTGLGMRGEQLGIVVGWNATEETCYVYRCAPDLSTVDLIDEWVNDKGWGDTIPRVIMAEVFGRVFMAHDEPVIGERAGTAFYDSTSGELDYLSSTWADGTTGESAGESSESATPPPAEDRIRFRGVTRHLSYLCGWGFGDAIEPRPELLRISLPDDPTTFPVNHYFIAGDRDDPVTGARSVGGDPGVLKVWKRQEAYDLLGSSRRDFGLFLADSSFGLVAGRATVDIGNGTVIAWSEEGPRLWAGRGASQSLEIPLGLDEWEPDDLPAEGDEEYAYGLFVPRERVAWFAFNRRVYALTVRNPSPSRWRWSYQQLPFDTYGAMTFYEGEVAAIAPIGYPAYNLTEEESASHTNPTVPGGTFADVSWRNFNAAGDEVVEVWMRTAEVAGGSGALDGTVEDLGSGQKRAAVNFEDAVVGGGIPTGWSTYLNSDDADFDVAEDVDEGKHVVMSGHPGSSGKFAFDAWNDEVDVPAAGLEMEMLARVYYPAGWVTGRHLFGPGFCLGQPDEHGLYYMPYAANATNRQTRIDRYLGSSGTNVLNETPFTGGEEDRWVWIRARWRNPTSGADIVYVNTWEGDLADEPAGWGAGPLQSNSANLNFPDPAMIGWAAISGAVSLPDQRLAFFSWALVADADTDPPLTPDDAPSAPAEPAGDWFLAGSFPVSTLFQQTERVTDLESGTDYEVSLRYRRGLLYNAGAEDESDPSAWPSISRGTFTTTLDNPTISSAVWERTGGAAEGITLTIVPDPDNADEDINVYRRASTESEPTLIDTLSAPHADPLEYEDTTIAGETIYFYTVTHESDSSESPFSDETRVWSGPADVPVRSYLNEFIDGYTVGFTIDAVNDVELHDTYDDAGGTAVTFSLRNTEEDAAVTDEISALNLLNVDPDDGASFAAKLRVKETAFSTDDFGEFSTAFPVNVEGSEFE